MSRPSSSVSKPSLSSFGYRENDLAGAGIKIDEIVWPQLPVDICQNIVEMLDFAGTVPIDTPLAARYASLSQSFRIAPNEQALPQAMLARAETISKMALQELNKPEAHWTKVIEQALAALMSDPEFDYMQDALWNASSHPLPRAASLPLPKPDYAIGFRITEPEYGDVRTVPVWSKAFIRALKAQPGLYLSPNVATSQPALLYPFFVFEAKSALGSSYGAVNQLSGSLSYALGKLRQLRGDAISGTVEEPLCLFGAVSAGRSWDLYVAYEVDPAEPELRCALVTFWSGNILDLGAALEFVWIIERIRQWALSDLKMVLTRWLESLRPV